MLLLVLISNYVKLDEKVRNGIQFISNLYIPIIVAMASIQNVAGALRGGWVAILGGGLAVVLSFLLVPVVVNLGKPSTKNRGVKA
ncbi:MAG: hypothetical protein DDT39_00535 [Firmicutes bacterium]|nr:hypothetical protein [candidate division NPL-UPA2 bacterium]